VLNWQSKHSQPNKTRSQRENPARPVAMCSDDSRHRGPGLVTLLVLICLLSVCGPVAGQSNSPPPDCATPEVVFQRYVAALGGEAALNQVQTLVTEARATEPHTFSPQDTAHYRYKFKWRLPNQVAVEEHYLLSPATIIFDGNTWSNFNGRVSHNEDSTPAWRTKLRSRAYNDYPEFLMFRVVADPMLVATTRNLYDGFEILPGAAGVCVLQANGTSEWGRERHDILSFDAKSGLLRTWAIQMGLPGQETYTRFQFDDYRQSGPVQIPFSIYFDFYKATFHLTKVVPNALLSDAEFLPKR
jgi:hypothetical protein